MMHDDFEEFKLTADGFYDASVCVKVIAIVREKVLYIIKPQIAISVSKMLVEIIY